ncbi:MAG: universal stress protein [Cyclobacteriaceae bacterium]|nr:universal stress protein [Cyclobacteriaceae bacterium]MCB0500622.1 universal stress protein [Cyclobacteriaceae bacterium]MCB9236329.1 universal stress protein [Flammeovirgaceae bacterium]MCO5272736.1 universal stress protein [Cyclobacteriaceae bacterium]MCW5902175.1 universal stress protein [Cyclobacteriaceae bacterium]
MKSILIPIDFSAYAKTAMDTGIVLSRKTGAEVFLLHVFSAPPDWNRISVEKQQEYPEHEARMVEAEIKMDKLVKGKGFKGVKVTPLVRPGMVRDEVLSVAKLYKISLIIMGAHGVGESHRYFIGSQAQKVMRTSPCPVLSVKKDFKPSSMKRVVFAADFDEDLNRPFKAVAPFLKATKASLTLLYINTPAHFKETPMVAKAMKKIIESYPEVKMKGEVYNAFDVGNGILAFAEAHKADVIIKVTRNRSKRAGYDFGITEALLYKSTVPVLSVVAG